MLAHILLLLFCLLGNGCSLRIVRIVGPDKVLRGENVVLECQVDMGNDRLYSLTWWKDDKPFYRYSPRARKDKATYSLSGIYVDDAKSSMEKVALKNVSVTSSGSYKCELLADPSFEKEAKLHNMTVIHRPEVNPEMHTTRTIYKPGDVLVANCTSHRALPPPNMSWFINDKQVAERYGKIFSTALPFTELMTRTSQLRLSLQEEDFDEERLTLSCKAFIHGFYNQISTLELKKYLDVATLLKFSGTGTTFGAPAWLVATACLLVFRQRL